MLISFSFFCVVDCRLDSSGLELLEKFLEVNILDGFAFVSAALEDIASI